MAKQVTLADVAARAGVSVALVSIVMRDAPGAAPATRDRVMAAARTLGYQPDRRARLLRSGRTRLLGVVFGVEHAFHGDLVTGLYEASSRLGYELTLSAVTPLRGEETAVRSLLQDRCEALLLLGPQMPRSGLRELAARMPVVVLARGVRDAGVDTIRTADADGLAQAVEHLAGLGHRRIAHIDGGRAPGAADRRRGYRTAMRRLGLERQIRIVPGGLTEEDGATAAQALLDDPPTAVTVFNDRCATGVLEEFRDAGLAVPGDISVTGFDDSRIARLRHVALTTIAQDTSTLAELAVSRAASRIADPGSEPSDTVVPPRLVVRATTGPAPSAP